MRKNNTTFAGNTFSKSLKDDVWTKRTPHPWGPDWGYDKFRHIINYQQYGKATHKYGWDIDHSRPVAKGGTDHINNLQPLQSYYNRYVKRDNYPWGGF
jgi:hypothetical protein